MSDALLYSESFSEGFALSRTTRELRIDTTDHRAPPLRLNSRRLARFGLQLRYGPRFQKGLFDSPYETPDRLRASLDRAIGLMTRQKRKGAWKKDIENLQRAWMILDRLDEAAVQAILNEDHHD
jgi:hypothetical protein